jgi:hypothetical protein
MPFMLVSWAGYIALECWQNGGGSEKYTTHGENTAAGGYGRGHYVYILRKERWKIVKKVLSWFM